MSIDRLRVGIIGLSPDWGWARIAHVPALRALPGLTISAVCTTRQETAEATARHFGIPLAFSDPRALARHPDVDLVAVTVKVPDHHALVAAALDAGKHVYCEWPLDVNTQGAERLRSMADAAGVRHMVGLQARGAPVINRARDLVAEGFVGRVLSTTLLASTPVFGSTTSRSATYAADRANGATTLTIHGGHSIDALCYCLGEFREVSATVARQFDRATIAETGEVIDKSAPDQVAVTGVLESGAVASIHIQGGTVSATGLWFEINGAEGDLVVSSAGGVQLSPLTLRGARRDGTAAGRATTPLDELAVPDRYRRVPQDLADGPAFNLAQQYQHLAECIRTGAGATPDFAVAVARHRLLDAIERASDSGQRQAL